MTKKSNNTKTESTSTPSEGEVNLVNFLHIQIPLDVISEMQKFKDMPENKEVLARGGRFAEVMFSFGPMTVEMTMMDFIKHLGLLPKDAASTKAPKK